MREPVTGGGGLVVPITQLRRRYLHARKLDAAAQTQECIDYLQNPEILVAEFVESYRIVENCDLRERGFRDEDARQFTTDPEDDRVVQRLAKANRVRVQDAPPYEFQCVTRALCPLPAVLGQELVAIDYVGRIAGAELIPVLGAVCDPRRGTAYLALLRLLTTLSEIASECQVERLNRYLFKDELERCPAFDLQILLVGAVEADLRVPLFQFSRDLAHALRVQLLDEWQFPDLLRQICCLKLEPGEFRGDLSSLWKA